MQGRGGGRVRKSGQVRLSRVASQRVRPGEHQRVEAMQYLAAALAHAACSDSGGRISSGLANVSQL